MRECGEPYFLFLCRKVQCIHRRTPNERPRHRGHYFLYGGSDSVWTAISRPQHVTQGYFLASRDIPWWAISLSIVAAETSTLTIVSVPGLAFGGDFRFLQLVLGYLVGRVIICVLLIPHYFRGDLLTAYGLIDRRFGHRLRSLTAGLFLITRAAAEGVRVFAVAIVIRIALGSVLTRLTDFRGTLRLLASSPC